MITPADTTNESERPILGPLAERFALGCGRAPNGKHAGHACELAGRTVVPADPLEAAAGALRRLVAVADCGGSLCVVCFGRERAGCFSGEGVRARARAHEELAWACGGATVGVMP